MISLLHGENDFETAKKVAQLVSSFGGQAERYDAADLNAEKLADIFAGQTLFAEKRFVIIDNPSASGELWQNMADWAARLSDDTQVVLIEAKPDKRTSTYRWLQKHAELEQFTSFDSRDTNGIAKWVETYAKSSGVALTTQQIRRLVERVGADQWSLAQAVEKLGLLDSISDEWIDSIVDAQPNESAFALFETALNGDMERLHDMIAGLRLSEDAYRLLGLVSSQLLQLLVLVHGGGDVQKVATDTGAKSSYPYQKLASYAARLHAPQVRAMIEQLAKADMRLKTSDADPWLVLEHGLFGLSSKQ